MLLRQRIDVARAELAQADHNAAMIVAALAVGVSVALTGLLGGGVDAGEFTGPQWVLWIAGGMCAAVAVVAAVVAVWPTESVREEALRHVSVGAAPVDAVLARVEEEARGGIRAVADELLDVRRTIARKHRAMKLAMLAGGGAAAALALAAFGAV